MLALHVDPLPDLGPELRVDGEVLPVACCASVLGVRERIAALRDDSPPLVLLTPLGEGDLGLDATAQLPNQRLVAIEPWQLVKEAFRARHVDPRLVERHAWVRDLLIEKAPLSGWPPAPSGFLDAETPLKAVFDTLLGLPGGARDPESLLELEGARIRRWRAGHIGQVDKGWTREIEMNCCPVIRCLLPERFHCLSTHSLPSRAQNPMRASRRPMASVIPRGPEGHERSSAPTGRLLVTGPDLAVPAKIS